MITYRIAIQSDWKAIAQLHAQSWQVSYRGILTDHYLDHEVIADREQVWEKRFQTIADNQHVILAIDGQQFCGLSCVYADHDSRWDALLDNLHVLPAWRGKGIGAELLLRGAAWVYARNPKSAYHLWVYEENTGSRAFYERMGGKQVETISTDNPGGGQAQIVRYVWENLGQLVGIGK